MIQNMSTKSVFQSFNKLWEQLPVQIILIKNVKIMPMLYVLYIHLKSYAAFYILMFQMGKVNVDLHYLQEPFQSHMAI